MTDSADRFAAAVADRYRIERELGQGGMATVYLAHDIRHDRKVAIKVLREDLAASMGSARFLREIQIAAQLQHPNILPLLDSGDTGGFLHYVMPFVSGQSLRECSIRDGPSAVSGAAALSSRAERAPPAKSRDLKLALRSLHSGAHGASGRDDTTFTQ